MAPTGTPPTHSPSTGTPPTHPAPTDTRGSEAGPAGYCDRCGRPTGHDGSAACARARTLEPPRHCAACRRRMVVQVTPTGWSARCAEHGIITSDQGSDG